MGVMPRSKTASAGPEKMKKTLWKRDFLALLLAVVMALEVRTCDSRSTEKKLPHILLIVADDFGWHNAGFHSSGPKVSEEVHTPNMNQMVKDGLELDRFYSYKICSPSRSSLQTGRIAQHVNVENVGPESFNPEDTMSGFAGIPRNMTGMATRLLEAGYRTHMVGKWDVGMATFEHTPRGRGYETSRFYFHHANDYWTYGLPLASTGEINVCMNLFTDFTNDEKPGKDFRTSPATYEEEWFLERSLDIIGNHNTSEPLFLSHMFHIVHTPLQVPEEYEERFDFIDYKNRRTYAAMVAYMDDVVGSLRTALEVRNMWDDTLVFFLSDNGGPIYTPGSANNYPLRGGKYSDWEGGNRVNAFVSGGWVPQNRRGKVISDYIHVADVYATFLGVAGLDSFDKLADLAGLPPVDGIDQSKVLLGEATGLRKEIHLSETALIQGPYKLVMGDQPMTAWTGPYYPNATGKQPGFFPPGFQFTGCRDGCLFNIWEDPTEHQEISATNSSVFDAMKKRLAELNKDNFNPHRGKGNIKACIQAIRNGGFYGPFLTATDLEHPHTVGRVFEDPEDADAHLKFLSMIRKHHATASGVFAEM
mmetsp:Transcript_16486/g.32008  ORF Transcript_16486/g.32008 Transcript_16486/m.32008 type:complete len:589 (+) Transcript_16486:306-2072(+)